MTLPSKGFPEPSLATNTSLGGESLGKGNWALWLWSAGHLSSTNPRQVVSLTSDRDARILSSGVATLGNGWTHNNLS